MNRGPTLVAVCLALAIGALDSTAQSDVTPRYTNRLINEKSPYLLLHAHNPVDWFPWGPEAFDKARRERKPIFLSIGYATCHWCHVMEAESFSDPGVAALMNKYFVSIKVDREERPDVDRIYISYVASATGGASWPLSVFLTPDLKPFLGGGYFPRDDDPDGPVGFRTVLERVGSDWTNKRDTILEAAKNGTAIIVPDSGKLRMPGSAQGLTPAVLDETYKEIVARYDAAEGGFGTADKFPRPVALNFLLREYARTGSKEPLDVALKTLTAMARGGIHDQLGGGFHRYTTDRAWRVPHFEKMLYDQAQLAVSYTEAYQITKDTAFADIARDTLDYVLDDLRSPTGGFFSAEDADSPISPGSAEQLEGAFYVWTADDIRRVLGDDLYPVFAFHYGVQPSGRNVLFVAHTLAETAAQFARSQAAVGAQLVAARQRLRAARDLQPRPPRDDKVLVSWNALMISALVHAAEVFDEPRYLEAARASAQFIESAMYDARANVLKRRYRDGAAEIDGVLEDYAFLVQASLDLYEASFDVKWLSWALRLQERQDQLFWDAKGGGYFSTSAQASNILLRMKDDYDGSEPSANSVAALSLLRLAQVTDRREWRDKADATFKALAVRLARSPGSVPQLGVAIGFKLSKPRQIVIAGEPGSADTQAMLRLVYDRFMPNKILLLADGGAGQAQIARWLPFVGSMDRREGRATIYICENYACRLPTNDLQTAARLLDGQ